MFGVECCPTKRRHVQQLNVVEICILQWICDHTRDPAWNDNIHESKCGTNQGEACTTSFEMVWTHPIEAPRGTGWYWGNKSDR
jgi:hypothetical protein